jgi:hypothetical protein
VYLGFDYSDFSDMPSDVHRWVKVLRVRAISSVERALRSMALTPLVCAQAAASTTWGKDQGREDTEILNNQRNFQ